MPASLTCNSLRKQGLTSSRRAYKQSTLRNLTTKIRVFCRILQELYNLLHLLLSAYLSCYILECNTYAILLAIDTSLRLTHAEHTATDASTAAHSSHEEEPDKYEECQRSYVEKEVHDTSSLLVVVSHIALELAFGLLCVEEVLNLLNAANLNLNVRVLPHFLGRFLEHIAHVPSIYVHAQVVLGLINYYLIGITSIYIRLESAIRHLVGT